MEEIQTKENSVPSPISSSITPKPSKKRMFIIAGIVIVVLYVILNIGIFSYVRSSKKISYGGRAQVVRDASVKSSTPTPTPHPLTSKGLYKFSISAGKEKPTIMTKGMINPIDPEIGGKQDLELTAVSGAKNLTATLTTDTKKQTVLLTKDPEKPDVWKGSWIMDDTYSYIYTLNVSGTVGGNEVNFPFMFR